MTTVPAASTPCTWKTDFDASKQNQNIDHEDEHQPIRYPWRVRIGFPVGTTLFGSGPGADVASPFEIVAPALGIDVERRGAPLHDLFADDHAGHPVESRQLEHRLEQDRLHDRAQAARPGLARDR